MQQQKARRFCLFLVSYMPLGADAFFLQEQHAWLNQSLSAGCRSYICRLLAAQHRCANSCCREIQNHTRLWQLAALDSPSTRRRSAASRSTLPLRPKH